MFGWRLRRPWSKTHPSLLLTQCLLASAKTRRSKPGMAKYSPPISSRLNLGAHREMLDTGRKWKGSVSPDRRSGTHAGSLPRPTVCRNLRAGLPGQQCRDDLPHWHGIPAGLDGSIVRSKRHTQAICRMSLQVVDHQRPASLSNNRYPTVEDAPATRREASRLRAWSTCGKRAAGGKTKATRAIVTVSRKAAT